MPTTKKTQLVTNINIQTTTSKTAHPKPVTNAGIATK